MNNKSTKAKWEVDLWQRFVEPVYSEMRAMDLNGKPQIMASAEDMIDFIKSLLVQTEQEVEAKYYQSQEFTDVIKLRDQEAVKRFLGSDEGKIYRDYQTIKDQAEQEVKERILKECKDHYWDSLEGFQKMILYHIREIINNLK
jgi:AAA+ ATPase superfamily predicted ATPase